MGGVDNVTAGIIQLHKAKPNLNLSDPAVLDTYNLCDEAHCPVKYSNFHYNVSLAANAILLALFVISLLLNAAQGWMYKKWSFMTCMFLGGIIEIIGYAARVMAHSNAWDRNAFLAQIICLTIAPIFYTAAIYICFTQIIGVFGTEYSRITPKMYYYIFCSSDFVALVLQGGGGGIAATADTQAQSDTGTHTMLGGLIFQVVTLAIFICLTIEYAYSFRKRTRTHRLSQHLEILLNSKRFKLFCFGLFVSTMLIIARSVYRAAEMAEGWSGALMADQATFIVCEGVFVIIAVLILNVAHPGVGLAKAEVPYTKNIDTTSEAGMEMMGRD